jgi:hypothetical protein
MKQFKELGIKPTIQGFVGDKIRIDKILNKEILVCDYRIEVSKYEKGNGKCLYLQIEIDSVKRVVFTGSSVLMDVIIQIEKRHFPFSTTIVRENDRFEFT